MSELIKPEAIKALLLQSDLSAKGVAAGLGISLTQETQKKTLSKVRAAIRHVVDKEGGSRDTQDEEGNTLYSLKK